MIHLMSNFGIRTLLAGLLTLMSSGSLWSQEEITFTATGPGVVQAGTYFRVSYVVNAKSDEFNGPRISDFEFNGPMLSTSMSTQIINGQVSQSASYTYNYTMVGNKPGVYTLEPATVKVNGKTYRSNSIKIEVVSAGATSQQGKSRQNTESGVQAGQVAEQDLFARVEVNRKSVFKGEQVIATIRIYTRVNLARFGEVKMPSYSGFWSQDIPTPNQITMQRENINGTLYNVGVIKKSVLVPQQAGEITIDPFEIECYVNLPRQRNQSIIDDFFGNDIFGGYQTVLRKVSSPPITLQVKSLPAPTPEGFSGGVGKLSFSSVLDKNSVKVNEAITYKITVKGSGNLKLIDVPEISFPVGLDVYDPKVLNNFQAGEGGINGSKTYEYLIIPRLAGSYRLPALTISWFDPESGRYQNTVLEERLLDIARGDEEQSQTIVSGLSREDVKVLGKDIRFIKTSGASFRSLNRTFFNSSSYWLFFSAIIILSVLVFITNIIRNKQRSDLRSLRFRRALSRARRSLKKTRSLLSAGKTASVAELLLKLLWGYLGDKLRLDPSRLESSLVHTLLLEKGINETEINKLLALIESCQFIQYAPGAKDSDLAALAAQTEEMINRLERLIKQQP